MMAIFSQRQGGVAPIATGAGYYPSEGSRVMNATYSWSGTTSQYTEDLSEYVAEGKLSTIQTVYIDNSQCAFPVSIQILGSNQIITCGALTQVLMPCYFSAGPRFKIAGVPNNSSFINGINPNSTNVFFLNIPCDPTVSSLSPSSVVTSSAINSWSALTLPAPIFFSTPPANLRMFITQLNFSVYFGTPIATAGTLPWFLVDAGGGATVTQGVLSFGATDATVKSVTIASINYLQAVPGNFFYLSFSTYTGGAITTFAGTSVLNYTLLPIVQ